MQFNSEFQFSQCLAIPDLHRLSSNHPFPLLTRTSSVLQALPTTSRDRGVTPKPADRIVYNSEVERALDVSLIRSLDTGRRFFIRCVKFSKDGKYLAVGFYRSGATNVYDVQTGEKTWLVCDELRFSDNLINFWCQHTERYH